MGILVTILTVSYNSEKTVARTIESVLNQTYRNIEYIIIDGQSTDNTVKIAQSYIPKFAEKNISYRIISEKDNGMYDALNKGIKLAKGEIVGSVNSDDFYELCAVEEMARKYEESHFDMAYADLRIIKPTGNFIKKAKIKKIASTTYWNHPTTFIAKRVYDKEKYKLESMYDDCDLMLRIRRKGYKIVVINKVLSNFVFGGMSTRKNLKETVNRIRICGKIYTNNGYSRLYYLDSAAREFAKLILG